MEETCMTLEAWLGPRPMTLGDANFVSMPTPLAHPPLPLPAALHTDRRDELFARDAQVKELFASGGAASALPTFRDAPLSGCTTMLDIVRRDAGFDPTAVTFEDPHVDAYFTQLAACPLFQPQQPTGTWAPSPVIGKMPQFNSDLVGALLPQTRDTIVARLNEMAARAGNGNLTVDPLYHSAISDQGGQFIVQVVILRYQAVWIRMGPFFPGILEGGMAVRVVTVRFCTEMWAPMADMISRRHYQSVTDWLASN
jgi:hypothetical protein